MKIKGVDFPEPLLNALRDGKLVVFAGAGVSMGPPAELPSFSKLAAQVAEGTGKSKESSETEDQFLSRLESDGVKVHQRAADILKPNDPQPNSLHKDLLRLFAESQQVRIVTTNFDCLFEQAAKTNNLFNAEVRVFQAPALPLGGRFHGIVHLHGSVGEPEEMVLTHRDFGRAYLTEADGWARRFLVHLFSTYTVLFIGYRHRDTIMTYLTPSLPPDGKDKRFALVSSESDDLDRWSRMGIETITFLKEDKDKDKFVALKRAVKGLADFMRRDIFEWQEKINNIASVEHPLKINDENSHTIDYALKRVELTRFFVQSANSSEWIDWLDQWGHLKSLFTEGKLEDQGRDLAYWLARNFTGNDYDPLVLVILNYDEKLNPHFSDLLLQQLGCPEKLLKPKTLSRWVPVLMSCVPTNVNEYCLFNLAKRCASIREFQSLLQVYDVMAAKLIWFLPELDRGRNNPWMCLIEELWRECLKPNLLEIAHTLLERTTMRLEQRYSARIARNDDRIDCDSWSRQAIEPHPQNERLAGIDPLIDIARDCLDWLAIHEPVTVSTWCDRFANDKAPLLRRLAIHATNVREDLSAQDKMAWLLEKYDINDDAVHHEIFRITADVYSQTSQQQKQMLIQIIYQYQISTNICNDAVKQLAYQIDYQFDWFQWLHKADPNCSLVKAELDRVQAQYPKLQSSEHPDFTEWTEEGQLTGPWTVEELWDKPASKWLPNLLKYQSGKQEHLKTPRLTMLSTVRDALEKNIAWGLDLADAMAAQSMWSCDLWECVIAGWAKGKLDPDTMGRVLSYLSANQLYPRNPGKIADVLSRLTERINEDDAIEFLNKLNSIAINLYPHAAAVEFREITATSWLTNSIHHPSGKLAFFWINKSMILWYKQQSVPPQALNAEYRRALDTIMGDDGISGKIGRTILASRFHVLYHVDNAWTEKHLLPLFDAQHEEFECAWDGYLTRGRLSPSIANLLKDKFIGGLQRVVQKFSRETLECFINFYVLAMSHLIENAKDEWISEFFKHTRENTTAKHTFTLKIGHFLHDLDESSQKEWWNAWLKDYWRNRLYGVPCLLENEEITEMLEWVIHLQGVFPDAIAMAVKMELVTLGDHSDLLEKIAQSNLIDRYPNELAQFLIYLGKSDHLPWLWSQDPDVFYQLLQKDLPKESSKKLREIVLRLQI